MLWDVPDLWGEELLRALKSESEQKGEQKLQRGPGRGYRLESSSNPSGKKVLGVELLLYLLGNWAKVRNVCVRARILLPFCHKDRMMTWWKIPAGALGGKWEESENWFVLALSFTAEWPQISCFIFLGLSYLSSKGVKLDGLEGAIQL